MSANGISSIESTSIRPEPGPTGYRPPGLTLGRFHSRNDTVISPASTSSRNSWLNCTLARLTRDGDGLDLNKLVRIPENGDTKQRARHIVVAEDGRDLVPGRDQIRAVGAGDVDRGLDHVLDRGTGFGERGPQIRQALPSLRGDGSRRRDLTVRIERASSRGEDQARPLGDGRVRVRGIGKQASAANQVYAHSRTLSQQAGVLLTDFPGGR